MTYFDDFKKRMEATGTSNADAFSNATVALLNSTFAESPFYKVIQVGAMTNVGVRLLYGQDKRHKELLFRPISHAEGAQNPPIQLGQICNIDSKNWMIMDYELNDLFPKANISTCNETLKWVDRSGEALYQFPVVAQASRYIKYNIIPNHMDVDLLSGGIFIYVQRTSDTIKIRESQRFIFGDSVYEISGKDDLTNVDKDGVGLIQFTTRLTTTKATDNFTTRVADNSTIYTHDVGSATGGTLW